MNIKEQRERAGLTQSELANLVLVTPRTVERWEAGHRVPSAAMLELIRIKLSDLHYDRNEAAKEAEGFGSCTECGDDYTDMPNSGGLCHDCYTGQSVFEYGE